MKKPLIIAGAISVMLGISGMITEPEPQMLVYEEIPHEEVQTDIEEKEQEEDLGIDEAIEPGQDGSDPEELPPAAGEVIELSLEDAQLLMKIAQAEAGNQGTDGMWLVMSVVINRVNCPDFPDSIRAVIYQPYQFAADRMDKVEITPEAHEALARIERGDIAPEIVAFETTDSSCLDVYFCKAFDYRDHQFYTAK